MKLKENKGMTLIALTIILAILVIAAGGVIVYLLNNREIVPQNIIGNNQILNNTNDEANKNKNQIADNNETQTNKNEDKFIKKVQLDKYEDIIVEAAYVSENERVLIYTRKDKNNNVIWTYNTGIEIEAQYNKIQSNFVKDRIYIDEYGTITVLNKKTGKTIWKWKYCEAEDVKELAYLAYLDEEKNTYITYGKTLTVLDKDGKVKSTTTYDNIDLTDSHCAFTYISKTEGIILGNENFALINLNDYTTKLTGTYNSGNWEDINKQVYSSNLLRDEEGGIALFLTVYSEGKKLWAYRTDFGEVAQCDIYYVLDCTDDRVYLVEEGNVVVFNKETGKIIWKNSNAEGKILGSHYLDKEQNLYLYYDKAVHILDKNGKEKAVISHSALGEYLIGEGPTFKYINEKELVLECYNIDDSEYGPGNYNVVINLEDYSIKDIIKRED